MAKLTPYDTGQRAEPHIWLQSKEFAGITSADEFGKVDFDNDEGTTVATIWLEKNEHSGNYVVHIEKRGFPLGLDVSSEE